MDYTGILSIFGIIFGVIIFFNLGNISDWYRENRYRENFSGALCRFISVVFQILYWPLKIISHIISGLIGIAIVLGTPLLYIGFFYEAWTNQSWLAIAFLSIIGIAVLCALCCHIYNKFKK